MASAVLWLLGTAIGLIADASISDYRLATPVWDTAVAGQIVGLLGFDQVFLADFA